jgi:hypothetical protein
MSQKNHITGNKIGILSLWVMQAMILVFVMTQSSNQLNAGVVDMVVAKDNSYVTLSSSSAGDHIVRLDTSGIQNILHHYKVTQNGVLEYAGFRNITIDYAMADFRLSTKRGGNSPVGLLKSLHGVYKGKDEFKAWKKAQEDNMSSKEKSAARKDSFRYIHAYTTSARFFKKAEPGEVRMMAVKRVGTDDSYLFVADHTNKMFLVYGLDNSVGLNLTSVRKFNIDEQVADPEQSDLLIIGPNKPYPPKELGKLLEIMQKARTKGKPMRSHN